VPAQPLKHALGHLLGRGYAPIEGGQSLGLGAANHQERTIFFAADFQIFGTIMLAFLYQVIQYHVGDTGCLVMSNIANRFGGIEAVTKSLHDPFHEKPKSFPKVRRVMVDDVEKSAAAPEAVKPKLVENLPTRKAKGRPKVEDSINSQKPWEAEGVSRMTWYRRQKSKGEV
jgi:hypothetical protein